MYLDGSVHVCFGLELLGFQLAIHFSFFSGGEEDSSSCAKSTEADQCGR